MKSGFLIRRCCIAMLCVGLAVSSVGCFKEMAQLMYVIKGHKVDPPFTGLKSNTVAVVCVSKANAFGPDSLSVTIAKHVGLAMSTSQGDKIKVVSPKRVDEFVSLNGWNEDDSPVSLGKAVEADYVVVIDVEGYSIHDGATLYKGRSDWTATAYDINEDGKTVFSKGPSEFVFPEAGRPAMQTTERQFESFYLDRLCDRISKQFISYDRMESYADNAMMP
jgi:hypothetical protein